MKKAMTVNLKDIKTVTSDFLEKIIKNRRKLILTVLSVFGLWCGTKIYITEPEMVSNYLSNYTETIAQQHLTKAYIILLIINILPIVISMKNGFYALGSPIIMLCPCLSGILTGVINAWTFNNFRLNGVFFSLLSIIPFAVITMIININSSNESLDLSKVIAESLLLNKTNSRGEVKGFLIKQTVTIAIISILTLLQTIIIRVLADKLLFI